MSAPLALIDELLDDYDLRARLWRPQAVAKLVAEPGLVMFLFTGEELIEVHQAMHLLIELSRASNRNGGAIPRIEWLAELRKGAALTRSMPHVRHDSVTLPLDEPDSAANQKPINVVKVAAILGVDPKTVYRRLERHPALALAITSQPGDPLRFDEQQVRAYAATHPNRGAAAHEPDLPATHGPV